MRIERLPQPSIPPRFQPPVQVAGHDHHSGKEDAFRAVSRGLATAAGRLARNSRGLGHLSDATGTLGLSHSAVHTGLAVASVGLGAVDGVQAYRAFQQGDRTMGWLNAGGAATNLIGGAISAGEAAGISSQLGVWGAVAGSLGVACDAAEDFVDAQRAQPEGPSPGWLRTRGSVKGVGAALTIAGAISGEPTLQMLGNLVTLGGVVVHYIPEPR